MNFSSREKIMFQTVFSCSRDENLSLLDFFRYLHAERVADQICSHPLFAPSPLWKKWASETFLGFSLEKLLVQGGHAFSSSVEVGLAEDPVDRFTKARRAIGAMLNAFRTDQMRLGRDPEYLKMLFKGFYPHATVYPEHATWFQLHPNPYFRVLESHLLRVQRSLPERMLEIGAGACVNVAFYHSLNPLMRTVVVDLPETIFVGYSFLKAVLPALRITLPHEVDRPITDIQSDVVFLLPTQTDTIPDGSVDFCFNMSSFQEMDMLTVNHYLQLMFRKLRREGSLVSVNLEVSRYIGGNALKNYDFSAFGSQPGTQVAPFGTALVGHVEGLQMMQVEVLKEDRL